MEKTIEVKLVQNKNGTIIPKAKVNDYWVNVTYTAIFHPFAKKQVKVTIQDQEEINND